MYRDELKEEFDVPAFIFERGCPLDVFTLHDVRGEGAIIGQYDGRDLHETIIDGDGHRYVFKYLANRFANGRSDPGRLKQGEYIVDLCLIYEAVPSFGGRRGKVWEWLQSIFKFELAVPIGPLGGRRAERSL